MGRVSYVAAYNGRDWAYCMGVYVRVTCIGISLV
jgi:hypothetical protein